MEIYKNKKGVEAIVEALWEEGLGNIVKYIGGDSIWNVVDKAGRKIALPAAAGLALGYIGNIVGGYVEPHVANATIPVLQVGKHFVSLPIGQYVQEAATALGVLIGIGPAVIEQLAEYRKLVPWDKK